MKNVLFKAEVIYMQYEDTSLEKLNDFYMLPEHESIIVIILKGEEYWANTDCQGFANCESDKELIQKIDTDNYHYEVEINQTERIDALLSVYPTSRIAMKICGGTKSHFRWFYRVETMPSDATRANVYKEIKEELKKKGISAYLCKMPYLIDLLPSVHHEKWVGNNLGHKINQTSIRKEYLSLYLDKLTDYSYDNIVTEMKNKNYVGELGGENRTIFLVGPCLVTGGANPFEEELAQILFNKVSEKNLKYNVVKCVNMRLKSDFCKKVLEYDIKRNDIIIMFDEFCEKNIKVDLDITSIFNMYHGDKWLFQDHPFHTTNEGNCLIANALMKNIIEPAYQHISIENDNELVHKAEMQLPVEVEEQIEDYLLKIPTFKGQVGAIVANCNPFTYGHRKLVEYASGQVDWLYVFVVEEDLSYFPFRGRLKMVKEGLGDIDNVIVVPSGKFILSKDTFKNYFEKEEEKQIQVDVALDLSIFGRYIGPALHISKRFVGEEPTDNITWQYNQQMKEKLPEYGIELIEIPRAINDGEIISASKVRDYLKRGKYASIKKLVPDSTYRYIVEKKEEYRPHIAMVENLRRAKVETALYSFIQEHDSFILYGLGNDAEGILKEMDELKKEKLLYADKKAMHESYQYHGKTVLSIRDIVKYHAEDFILVASSKYGEKIKEQLVNKGMAPERIFVNKVAF